MLFQAGGDDRCVRDRLVREHLPAVRAVASHYRGLGLPFDDLVQEGSLGLLDAIDRYDAARGVPFDVYARFQIRRAIRNALTDSSRLIRLPKQIVERRRAVERARAHFAAAHGRHPTAAEVAAALGLSEQAVADATAIRIVPVSLDGSPGADDVLLADAAVADPEATALEHEQAELVEEAVAELPERQREIVSRHFGLDRPAEPIPQVAATLHLSQQRTRAIERDALRTLAERLDEPPPRSWDQRPAPERRARPRSRRGGIATAARRDRCRLAAAYASPLQTSPLHVASPSSQSSTAGRPQK